MDAVADKLCVFPSEWEYLSVVAKTVSTQENAEMETSRELIYAMLSGEGVLRKLGCK